MALIQLNNISKKFDETIALKEVNISFEKGKVYGVIGRNGAGKTTLLKVMSEMIHHNSGSLVKDAKILMLDEPYAGLDPINREYFYKVLQKYYFNDEKTVIISSHLISEIEGYFENAIIIDKGSVIVDESLETIYEQSFVVKGNNELLKWIKDNKNVIGLDTLANQNVIYIYDKLSSNDQEIISHLSGSIDGLDLQNLMIKLVSRKEVG